MVIRLMMLLKIIILLKATSGTAGTLGASDVTRFHNPKIDLVLDMLGLTGNVGDFIKFGISTYNDKK